MKKIIILLSIIIACTQTSIAQDATKAKDSDSQVEFYSSMEEFINKNMISQVHITIMSVAQVSCNLSYEVTENIQLEKLTVIQKINISENTSEVIEKLVL